MSKTMDLKSKLYQLPVVEHLRAGTPTPLVVELDTTGVCDLACPGCISEDIIALGNTFSDQRLMELGQEMIDYGVRAVILIGGGEPLAHRKAGALIELLGTNDVHVGITTNGTFIHRHLAPIAEYSRWTRISVDAATEETFRLLRPTKGGGSKFEKVLENMRALGEVKKGKMGFSFLIQTPADGVGTTNVGEIYDAAVLARDLGCDYYEVKPTYQFREGVDHALMRHDPELMREARKQVDRLDGLETESFKVLRAINLEASLNGVEVPQPKSYRRCPSTELRTTITPTGTYVCPYWRGKEPMKLGDVQGDPLRVVWEGAEREAVMSRLDPSVDCGFHCLRHETNEAVIALREKLGAGAEVRTVEEFDRFL